MSNLIRLQAERSSKAQQAEDIFKAAEQAEGGGRPTTAEENFMLDKISADLESLDAQIAAVLDHERRREQFKALEDRYNQPAGRQTSPDRPSTPAAVSPPSRNTVPATARRSGTLKAFKGHDADVKAYNSGLWLLATVFGNARAATRCMERGIRIDSWAGGPQAAMGTDNNTNGGFLVVDEMADAMIDLREQYGVFRREARQWRMTSDTLQIPRRAGGVTIGAIGENPSSGISESNPTLDMVTLVAKKAGGLTRLSSEINEDAAIDVADWVTSEFAYALALFEDQCGFIGDGTSTYLGIRGLGNLLTEAGGLAGAVMVATATHNLFSEIDATDLAGVMGKLPEYARMNAKWYCSSVAAELVFGRLMAAAGGNTVQTLQGGRGASYMGYPIVISQVLPAGPSTDYNGLPMLYFGDLKKSSALGDRRQLRVFQSEHRYMDTDQIGIRCTERFDIVNHDVGTASAAGPIVALVGSSS